MSGPIVLASGSPRRRDLLQRCGIAVEVRPQDIDETWDPTIDPVAHARRLAEGKARSALGQGALAPILAADTVVHLEGRIFDKPESREAARRHLEALSGRTHAVTTGVCVCLGRIEPAFSVTTQVRFRTLSMREIAAYLETGEADDKAGAYGIQGLGGAFVAELHGSWTNVMGLPLEKSLEALSRHGVAP